MEKDLMELVQGCGVAEPVNVEKIPTAIETAKLLAELGFTAAALSVEKRLRPALKKEEIAAGKYVEITPAKIQAYLERKAAEYNTNRPKEEKKRWIRSQVIAAAGTMMSSTELAQSYGQLLGQLQGKMTGNLTYTTNTTRTAAQSLGGYAQSALWNYQASQQQMATAPAARQYRSTEYFEALTDDASNVREGTIGKFRWAEEVVERYAGIPPLNVLRKFAVEKAKNLFDYFTVASVNAVRDPLLLGRIEDCESRYFIAQWGDDVSLDDVI